MTRARVSWKGRRGRSTSRPMTNSRWARRSRRRRRRVPAGTMTGAVANFTYPGTTGASCTVTYSVCAPAPNTTICDTAVLTVTAGARAGVDGNQEARRRRCWWWVARDRCTRSRSVWPMGRRRRRSTSVTYCRQGSAPTERSRRRRDLSGCPASGATSLAGCTVASGTNGPVVITVPVAVAANAANPDGEHGDGDGWRGSDLHELLGDDDEPGD